MRWHHTVPGLITKPMGRYGIPMALIKIGGLIPMVIGHILNNMAGCGFLTKNGVGRLFIMGAGLWIESTGGYGCRGELGRLPGCFGAMVAVMRHGHLCHQMRYGSPT